MKQIVPGTKFYCVEWYDMLVETPPFEEPKMRSITFLRNGNNEHIGEFIDDTGRIVMSWSAVEDWYSATPQMAYERHLQELYTAVSRTEDEIQKQQDLYEEFARQISLSLDKIKEYHGTTSL